VILCTITNTSQEPLGPRLPFQLPPPFTWIALLPGQSKQTSLSLEDLERPIEHSGFTPNAILQLYVQQGRIRLVFDDLDPERNPVHQAIEAVVRNESGGLPPFLHQQFAAIIENPAGTAVFSRLTQDMILPAFGCSIALAATPGEVEVGATVTNPSFSCAYVRPAQAAQITDGAGHTIVLVTPFNAGTIVAVYTKVGVNDSQGFTLSANEAGGPTRSASCGIVWHPRVFFGKAVPPGAYDEAFVEGLAANALAGGRQRTIAYNAVGLEKLYYCYPDSFGGAPSNFVDAGTGFAAGFSKKATVNVTNPLGVLISYAVWESDQAGLGAVSILVT